MDQSDIAALRRAAPERSRNLRHSGRGGCQPRNLHYNAMRLVAGEFKGICRLR